MKPAATLLLLLNFCMYVIILGIGGWSMNFAIDHGFIIGNFKSRNHKVMQYLGCYKKWLIVK